MSGRHPPEPPTVRKMDAGFAYRGSTCLGEGSFGSLELVGVNLPLADRRSGTLYGHRQVLLAGACKTLIPHSGARKAEVVVIYRREFKALEESAANPHPHLQRLLVRDGDRIVTQLAVTSLADYLGSGPLPIPEAIRLGRECCEGVRHLHQMLGYLHLDLKPGNVLIDAAGHAIVADIGGNPIDDVPHHAGQQPLPGDKHHSVKSDVFGLGRLVFEMLTHEPLLQRDEHNQQVFLHDLQARSIRLHLEDVLDGENVENCRQRRRLIATLAAALDPRSAARPEVSDLIRVLGRFERHLARQS